MGENYVQVPPNSTGVKLRTRERTVGANTVDEQYVIVQSVDVLSGVFYCHPGIFTVAAAAQVLPAAFWYLINPVGSAVLVKLRKIEFESQLGSALATPTSPRILLQKFTFIGTASGAAPTIVKQDSSVANPTASVRTASTGMTITQVGPVHSFFPVAAATAVAYNTPGINIYDMDEDGRVILHAGEGVCLYQADAGTTSDTRRHTSDIVFEEYTNP